MLWWYLPLKRKSRQNVKTVFFTVFGFLFRNTSPYKNWLEIRKSTSDIEITNSDRYPHEWIIEETRIQLVRNLEKKSNIKTITKLAIFIHSYYVDIFDDLIETLKNELSKISYLQVKLHVSTNINIINDITNILLKSGIEYEVDIFPNRGRDILPFLRMAERVSSSETLILKLHTKRSDHRLTGKLWRKKLYDSLLPSNQILKAVDYFNHNHTVGIIGPVGNIVPLSLYFGANALALSYFSNIFNITAEELRHMNFVAGSMFYARMSAIEPLIKLQIPETMFETESGQHDGTMAHAVERVFSLSAYFVGMRISDTSFPKNIGSIQISEDHPYTW